MSEAKLSFDRAGYSLDAVQRAAYRFSDRLSCDISEGAKAIEVNVRVADGTERPEAVLDDFRNEALDQVLRERIRAETSDVRNLVLALAFSKTGLIETDV
ncbi:MAG TPA: His-Xaa-Ser system protein HxsD [Solirubrobacterales bacterium]|nr:His-Xaa-Ser system protein HxsD [Solirubrobacterales bacterium]